MDKLLEKLAISGVKNDLQPLRKGMTDSVLPLNDDRFKHKVRGSLINER